MATQASCANSASIPTSVLLGDTYSDSSSLGSGSDTESGTGPSTPGGYTGDIVMEEMTAVPDGFNNDWSNELISRSRVRASWASAVPADNLVTDAESSFWLHPDGTCIPPLLDGQTFVVYHPHSGKQLEVLQTYNVDGTAPDFPETQPLANNLSMATPPSSTLPPWAPFSNKDSFLQAEIFVGGNSPDTFINKQLSFMQDSELGSPVSFSTAAEMHDLLWKDVTVDDMGETFSVPFRKEEEHKYTIRFRAALPALIHLLEDPDLREHLTWYPDQCYVRNPSKPGVDGVVIYVHVYADMSVVSSFGHTKVWAVYEWVGNVPKGRRNGRKKGRAILVGFIELKIGRPDDDPSKLALHRVLVYHRSLLFILYSLRLAGHVGTLINAAPSILKGFPLIAVVSMDYEEMVRATLILGARSGFPCPICLVPADALAVLTGTWARRTVDGTVALLEEARSQSMKKARHAKLKEQSLRDADNVFFQIMNPISSIYDTFICDPLHQIEQGTFGKHIFPWIQELLGKHEQRMLDENFKYIPRYPGMHHFPNGILSLQNISGTEHNIIAWSLVPCISGLIKEHAQPIYALLCAQACVLLLVKFTCHTEVTLELLRQSIAALEVAGVQALGIAPSFEFPKMHSNTHIIDIIRRKATIDNYHTGISEGLHPQTKKDYHRTNHQPQTHENQML
ncbi:hypothetical protein OF83DRAFT_1179977 [Amylostereum chailletii]|nr:hypothetical protein OF83DRAFT_1179977 [Amylostereum chailletii]